MAASVYPLVRMSSGEARLEVDIVVEDNEVDKTDNNKPKIEDATLFEIRFRATGPYRISIKRRAGQFWVNRTLEGEFVISNSRVVKRLTDLGEMRFW